METRLKYSNWFPVSAGAPKGSVLHLLFLYVYINDFTEELEATKYSAALAVRGVCYVTDTQKLYD